MASLGEILNGQPDSPLGNISRAGVAVLVPLVLGCAGGLLQSIQHPELGSVPPLVTFGGVILFGILEMDRQLRIDRQKSNVITPRF